MTRTLGFIWNWLIWWKVISLSEKATNKRRSQLVLTFQTLKATKFRRIFSISIVKLRHYVKATQLKKSPIFFDKTAVFKVCIIRLVHIFLKKIFVDFLTSTLLRAQNTTLLSKVRQRFFSNFVAFSENPNFTT